MAFIKNSLGLIKPLLWLCFAEPVLFVWASSIEMRYLLPACRADLTWLTHGDSNFGHWTVWGMRVRSKESENSNRGRIRKEASICNHPFRNIFLFCSKTSEKSNNESTRSKNIWWFPKTKKCPCSKNVDQRSPICRSWSPVATAHREVQLLLLT